MKKLRCVLAVLVCTSLAACGVQLEPAAEVMSTKTVETPKVEDKPIEATVIAAGDIMFHIPQINEARREEGFGFRMPFEKIRGTIVGADLAIANFETTVNEKKSLSGYPRFNSPPEVLEAIGYTGFDVLVTANNHCMDTGIEGAENTAALIRKNNMIPVGTGENNKAALVDVKGIKLGILSYTTSINGLKAPAGYVNMADKEQIKKDIENLKGKCDFIIVYLHAGVEYRRDIEKETAELFRAVADMGADCVLGSHPHVTRKSEIYRTNGRDVLINYSMGNFLSNQNDKYTDMGSMTKLHLKKQGNKTTLDNFEIIPTYRLRFVDTDGKTKRRIILAADVDGYSHVSETQKQYVRQMSYFITALMGEKEMTALEAK